MTLDSITLTDFGLYAGQQEINLAPPEPNKPIILFGGLNGGGKTTLLDALQLVFFGSRAKTSSRGRLGYSAFLSRCIHDRASQRRAAIQITFRHTTDGEENRYTLERAWSEVASGKCREEFRVLKNNCLAPALTDDWVAHVDNLLPYNIAHLFLFDGEQIERYASPDEAATLIGAAIKNLLGLDLVEQLDKDVRVYERRKSAESLDSSDRDEFLEAEEHLRQLRERLLDLKQQRASLQTHHIDPCRRHLRAIEDEFRRLGGELFERRREIEQELQEAIAALRNSEDALRQLATGSLPLRIVAALAESAAERDREEQDTERAMQVAHYLAERDDRIISHLSDHGVPKLTIAGLRDHLASDRIVAHAVAGRPTVLNLSPEPRVALGVLLHGKFRALGDEAATLLSRRAQLSAKLGDAEAIHDRLPSADALAEIIESREATKTELASLDAQYTQIGEEAERIELNIERQEKAIEGLLEAEVKYQERLDDRERILRCSRRVCETLAAFRDTMVARHLSRIERLVLDSYQQLLRKTSLVTRLVIDPRTFSLALHTRQGVSMSAESLSAGERQLLGIALLWGLAKASGRPVPTAIDTPLGRLDSSHRTHFVERYLPFVSHQTLVFSTDEEIVGSYLQRLRPWIGRTYRLRYHEAGHTCVEPGYFGTEP
ncbi:MAG: DNA sulfur modification protein DndD [Bryobacterales bacterium]|nr:DNA sulfur modification protein DndD [Bryobacterales bacterium]